MQGRKFGGIGDLIKIAFLRHLMEGRQLAVCLYLTQRRRRRPLSEQHFSYLQRPEEFRHLAPVVFDTLVSMSKCVSPNSDYIANLEASGLLGNAVFHLAEVPKRTRLHREWLAELTSSVDQANLVFLDPDNGIQGKRLTPKHVALGEIAALRRPGRALITMQRQSGRKLEARVVVDQLRSIGCERIEVVRFRLVVSQFYLVIDADEALSERIASFVRKWGNLAKVYQP